MEANGEMAPDKKDKKDLAEPCPGINPEIGDFVRVIDVDAGENARPARVDDVHEQEIRNRQSQQYLSRLPSGHSVMPSPGKSGQTAEGMHRKASVEKELANRGMPQRHHPRARSLLRLERNQTECVVREMHRDVESDDDATDGTEPGETSRRDQTR